MDSLQRLARNVRRIRVESGITQEALAFAAGMALSHISRIERADVNPTLDALTRLAQALHVDITALLADVDSGTPPVRNLKVGRKLHQRNRHHGLAMLRKS